MWIEETKDEVLRTWIKNCPAMKLVSRPNGEIVWANAAFLEWSQYTLNELKKLTWMQISVPDKNLDADTEELKSLDAYRPAYTVKKQYVPKGSKPEWGTLNVMRYPVEGEIEICLCTWEPLKNGTATAFALAMEQTQKFEEKLVAMTSEIKTLTSRTDDENWIVLSARMIQKHPKVAAAFLVVALSIFGLNNIVELLQRTGLVQIPVKIEKADTHENRAAMAQQIGGVVAQTVSVTTPAGNRLEGIGGRWVVTMPTTTRRPGSGPDRVGQLFGTIDEPAAIDRRGNRSGERETSGIGCVFGSESTDRTAVEF